MRRFSKKGSVAHRGELEGAQPSPQASPQPHPLPPLLHAIEWQLVMQFCVDHTSILCLARCSRTCLAAASNSFAWKDRIVWFSVPAHAPPAPSRLKRVSTWMGIAARPIPLATRLCASRILRHCMVGIHISKSELEVSYFDYIHLKETVFVPLRRQIRGLHDENGKTVWVFLRYDRDALQPETFLELRGVQNIPHHVLTEMAVQFPALRILHMRVYSIGPRDDDAPIVFPHVTELHLLSNFYGANEWITVVQRMGTFFPRLERLILECALPYRWWENLDPIVVERITTLEIPQMQITRQIPTDHLARFRALQTLVLRLVTTNLVLAGRGWVTWLTQLVQHCSDNNNNLRIELHLPDATSSLAFDGDHDRFYTLTLDHIEVTLTQLQNMHPHIMRVFPGKLAPQHEKLRRNSRKEKIFGKYHAFWSMDGVTPENCVACGERS